MDRLPRLPRLTHVLSVFYYILFRVLSGEAARRLVRSDGRTGLPKIVAVGHGADCGAETT